MGVFPQYYFGFASRGDRESDTRDVSKLSMLYFLFYNLPDAWQVGFNPTITYDDQAPSGDKWNVPIGLTVAKTNMHRSGSRSVSGRDRILGGEPERLW